MTNPEDCIIFGKHKTKTWKHLAKERYGFEYIEWAQKNVDHVEFSASSMESLRQISYDRHYTIEDTAWWKNSKTNNFTCLSEKVNLKKYKHCTWQYVFDIGDFGYMVWAHENIPRIRFHKEVLDICVSGVDNQKRRLKEEKIYWSNKNIYGNTPKWEDVEEARWEQDVDFSYDVDQCGYSGPH